MTYPRGHAYWHETYRCEACNKIVTRHHRARHEQSGQHIDATTRPTEPDGAEEFFETIWGGALTGIERLMYLWARSGIVDPATTHHTRRNST